jgi:hypothetical protein
MKEKKINIYKPKKVNVVKLKKYLSKIQLEDSILGQINKK